MYIWHVQLAYQIFEGLSSQCFCKDICQLMIGRKRIGNDFASLKLFPHNMTIKLEARCAFYIHDIQDLLQCEELFGCHEIKSLALIVFADL